MHERIGVMQLSTALKLKKWEVKLVLAERLGLEALKDLVKAYSPEIIGYSAMTGEHIRLLDINRELKKSHDFIAAFGGPHATFFPKLIEENGCDAICIGEGDVSFLEFCKRVANKENYWETPGFIVKQNGKIYNNPLMPLVEDLDLIPFPDRELMYAADPDLLKGSVKLFFSTRGCPHKCTYCFNEKYNTIHKGKGSVLRHRSPENLIEEIFQVKEKYPMAIVHIEDDTFLYKPEGCFEVFVKLYKEKINLPFHCNFRANKVNEEIVKLLKEAGLDSVTMGIECGNEKYSNTILKRNLKNERIIEVCSILKKYGLKIITTNLVGLPVPDSYEADLETLDLNIKIKPTFALCSILYPYPGTPIESYAREKGLLTGEVKFLETNKRTSFFNFSSPLEKRKIENLHKLFGLLVEFGFLRRYADLLCRLPLIRIYTGLFYFWYGYNFKIRIFPLISFWSELHGYLLFWWKTIKKN